MKKTDPRRPLIVTCFSILLLLATGGCQYNDLVKGAKAHGALLTDAPKTTAMKAAEDALKELGYDVGLVNAEKGAIQAYYTHPLIGKKPLLVRLNVIDGKSTRSVVCGVFQDESKKKSPDVIGYYPDCVRRILEKITKDLTKKGYRAQEPF